MSYLIDDRASGYQPSDSGVAAAQRAIRFAEGELALAIRHLPPRAARNPQLVSGRLGRSVEKLLQARSSAATLQSLLSQSRPGVDSRLGDDHLVTRAPRAALHPGAQA